MCRALRAAYIKNGGSDTHLLTQLAAVEKKAVATMNTQQPNPYSAGIFKYFNCTVFEYLMCVFRCTWSLHLITAVNASDGKIDSNRFARLNQFESNRTLVFSIRLL